MDAGGAIILQAFSISLAALPDESHDHGSFARAASEGGKWAMSRDSEVNMPSSAGNSISVDSLQRSGCRAYLFRLVGCTNSVKCSTWTD